MGEWKRVRIGDVLKEVSREKRLDPNTKYRLLGVKWYGKGVFLREEKYGKEIKATKLYQVKQRDFIYNRLFAWKSSFAIVPDEFDGCLVSNEFPLFTCLEGKLLPEFLLSYILLPENIAAINNLSGGMSSVSRKRFKEKDFLNFEVPQYDVETQSRICQRLKRMSEFSITQDLESAHQLSLIKQLRQRILQEAIEGKLTAKWRNEHPDLISGDNHASKLLEKIKTEKERLIKEGKIKKDKPLRPIADDEKPFDLPDGWVWCRLVDIGNAEAYPFVDGPFGSSINTKKDYINTGIPVLRMLNVKPFRFLIDSLKYVSPEIFDTLKRHNVQPNDILFSKVGAGIGEACVVPKDFTLGMLATTGITRLRVGRIVMPEYLCIFLNVNSNRFKLLSCNTAQPFLNMSMIKMFPFVLSPFAEQQVIVEQVDKLMVMIDELEKQVSERKEQSEMLMQSVLREAFAKR